MDLPHDGRTWRRRGGGVEECGRALERATDQQSYQEMGLPLPLCPPPGWVGLYWLCLPLPRDLYCHPGPCASPSGDRV